MKHNILIILCTAAFLSLTLHENIVAQSGADSTAIQLTVEDYIIGWREADHARLTRAFEIEEGRILWVSEDSGLQSVTFGQTMEKRKKQAKYGEPWEILDLDIVDGQLAVAKVFIKTKNGHYNDYLTLQKIDDRWKIVTKQFVFFRTEN